MIFDTNSLDRATLHGLINGLVYPRPIAWVSTISAAGQPNLAPFSFFNAFSFYPPTVAIGPGSRKGVNKDTLRNIRETGEFVVNVVTEDLAKLANATSAEFSAEINEWEALGIAGAESEAVRPRRVAASPAAFECRMLQIVELGDVEARTNSLILGRVVRIYADDVILDGARPRSDALHLVGRMGGDEWCRTRDIFTLR
ncbi:MAG: flavin reductase family protein, partial [candidate division Zixibacteria bacterium]|nr:flavin reductase family protein [candidate division Zixibacteria bacterium]